VEPTVMWGEWEREVSSEGQRGRSVLFVFEHIRPERSVCFLTLPGEKPHASGFLPVPWFPAGATTSSPDEAALDMAASTVG
jgi:hypothetical protein